MKMKKVFPFLALLLAFSCSTGQPEQEIVEEVTPTEESAAIDESFDIELSIDKEGEGQYNLVAALELEDGSYVVSPYSKDETYGHFGIFIAENQNLIANDSLIEIPASIEEFDSILNEPVKFVRTNTEFKRKMNVTGQEDFEVSGMIEFVLEPSCVPYEVEFALAQRSGVMEVEKTGVKIASTYKQ